MPERVQGAVVTPSLFPLLGIEPIAGRVFSEAERGEGNDNVVVISARLWQRRFNSDPTFVGKQLSLNGRSFTVVGIMPAKFEFPLPLFNVQGGTFAQRVDIWKPIAFTKERAGIARLAQLRHHRPAQTRCVSRASAGGDQGLARELDQGLSR